MFNYTIDKKNTITDRNGNSILDLTKSIFSSGSGLIKDYEVVKVTDHFHMRPDLVSYAMYETDQYAEYILKFSGISNPFTLNDDEVLLIPNDSQAEGMMAVNNEDDQNDIKKGIVAQIRNYYKFVNQEFKSDSTSYKNLENMNIPSGIIDTTQQKEYIVPYISEDGRTAVTVRGGKMYFGEDSGVVSANNATSTTDGVTKSVQSILNNTLTPLSDSNCLYNGTQVTDFIRASFNNN